MANRADEKARRRAERQAAEEAERKVAARKRRMQIIGGVLGALAVAGVAVALVLSGGDGGGAENGDGPKAATGETDVTLPAPEIGDYEEAAKAAGCTLSSPEIEGASHEERTFTPADYKTNPPTSGTHTPNWAQDGIYETGNTPQLGLLVHSLEHGRINVQYAPGTPAQRVAELEALLSELESGYHMLLYENTTDMDAAIAATAWGQSLTCPEFNDEVFDALRTFRSRYIDKGPENVP